MGMVYNNNNNNVVNDDDSDNNNNPKLVRQALEMILRGTSKRGRPMATYKRTLFCEGVLRCTNTV